MKADGWTPEELERLPRGTFPISILALQVCHEKFTGSNDVLAALSARIMNALIKAAAADKIQSWHYETLMPYAIHNNVHDSEDDHDSIDMDWIVDNYEALEFLALEGIHPAMKLFEILIENQRSQMDGGTGEDRAAAIHESLKRHGGNRTRVAEEFGVSRQRIGQIVKKQSDTGERKKVAQVPLGPFDILGKDK